jgi:SAM-dependent methyltransferase
MESRTIRRYYLDELLKNETFKGKVLDAGGHKECKRGEFRPPMDTVEQWLYLNIDEKTDPDYTASIDNIPLDDESFDMVLCTEVFEHLENPEIALNEIYRVLKGGGKIVFSMPFNFQIHCAPYDFQRWTKYKLKKELDRLGCTDVVIHEMGSYFAVLYDTIYSLCKKKSKLLTRMLLLFFPIIINLDNRIRFDNVTTGYYMISRKPVDGRIIMVNKEVANECVCE